MPSEFQLPGLTFSQQDLSLVLYNLQRKMIDKVGIFVRRLSK